MDPLIEFRGVSYRYPDARTEALPKTNLKINHGEFILVDGPSGAGKTTLLKCISGLVPHYTGGVFSGRVTVDGLDTLKNPVEQIALSVGIMFQDPENQIACTKVENEIAFGLENARLPRSETGLRIRESAKAVGVDHLLERKTSELSSGEKQKVILSAILAMKPKVLLLDEPFSQLDPQNVKKLTTMLFRLNRNEGTTILLVDHNFRENRKVDRIMRLGPPKPANQRISVGPRCRTPTVKPIIKVSGLSCSYGRRRVLHKISLEVREGEFVSVAGPNGAGKTTLLKHLNGLLKPGEGTVLVCGTNTKNACTEELASKVGLLSQNPNDYLFCDTVEDELRFTLRNLNVAGDVGKTLLDTGLQNLRRSYPRDLSGGERQRVALASILVAQPKILVLDEPTRGIDSGSKKNLLRALERIRSRGGTIVLATHDLELASTSDRIIEIDGGRIVREISPKKPAGGSR